MVGDAAGYLVIDDTALLKKGQHSVGVAPQYASSLGKTSNCQSLVSGGFGLTRTFGDGASATLPAGELDG